jgi:hypothetical protein
MNNLTTIQQKYLDVSRVLPWATNLHYTLWMTGKTKRHKATERVLPALVKKGCLVKSKYGKRIIYATPEKLKIYLPKGATEPVVKMENPYHGLGVSEVLVRLILSRPGGIVVGEKEFARFKAIPDGGVLLKEKGIILVEFQTAYSADQPGNLNKKLLRYKDTLPEIEKCFGEKALVLFVYDIPLYRLKMMVEEVDMENVYFTDYQSFLSAPYTKQLVKDIYIWGYDKQTYSLAKDG